MHVNPVLFPKRKVLPEIEPPHSWHGENIS